MQFSEFLADPLATIERIYAQLRLDLSAFTQARMRAFLEAHPGDGGGGGTRYAFANTGQDAGALRERAKRYQDRFGVVSEPVV